MGFALGEIFKLLSADPCCDFVMDMIGELEGLSETPKREVTLSQFMLENAEFCNSISRIRQHLGMMESANEIEAILQAICIDRIHRGIMVFTLNQIPEGFFSGNATAERYVGVQMKILSLSGIEYTNEEYKIAHYEILQSADMLHIIPRAYWDFMHDPDPSAVCPGEFRVRRQNHYGQEIQMPVAAKLDGRVLMLE